MEGDFCGSRGTKDRGIRLDLRQVVYKMRDRLNKKVRVLLPGLHRIRQRGRGEEYLSKLLVGDSGTLSFELVREKRNIFITTGTKKWGRPVGPLNSVILE